MFKYYFFVAGLFLTLASCTKNTPEIPEESIPVNPTVSNNNSNASGNSENINANAGADLFIILPNNECHLYAGYSQYLEGEYTISWKIISGPEGSIIEKFDNSFRVSNLKKGMYKAELTITAPDNTLDFDTTNITVNYPSTNEYAVLFENLDWNQNDVAWGSYISIPDIYHIVPPGQIFNVYIKRDSKQEWEQLILNDYSTYFHSVVYKGKFSIWSSFEEIDSPDIMFAYSLK